jgi:PAS domain S-box-containing protein
LGVTALLFFGLRHWEYGAAGKKFAIEAQTKISLIKRNLNDVLGHLQATGAFFNASEYVSRKEFEEFAGNILKPRRGLYALAWVPRIPADKKDETEASAQWEGVPDFKILAWPSADKKAPAARQEEYFPIYFAEPQPENRKALGFDLSSEPVRRQSMELARDSGEVVATAKVTLDFQPGRPFAVLVFLPIYHRDTPLHTLEDRRRHLKGFCLAVIRLGLLVENALKVAMFPGIDVAVSDESAAAGLERKLYFHRCPLDLGRHPANISHEAEARPELIFSEKIEVAGRAWKFVGTAHSGYVAAQRTWLPWVVMGSMLIITLVLTVYFGKIKAVNSDLLQAKRNLEEEITGRKRAQEALKEEKELFAALFEQAAVGMCQISPTGQYLRVNQHLCELLGYSREEMLRLNAEDVSHPEEIDPTKEGRARFLRGEMKNLYREKRYIRKDGAVIWCRLSAALVRDASGQPKYFIAVLEDITERKRAEEALRQSEEANRALVEAIPDLLVRFDREGNYTWFKRPRDFDAIVSEEMLGQNMRKFVPEDLVARRMSLSQRVWETGQPAEEEVSVTVKGQTKYRLAKYVRFSDREILAIVRDITDRKRAEEALRQSEEANRALVEAIPDALIRFDREGNYTWIKRPRDYAAIVPEEVVGQSMNKYMPAEVVARRMSLAQRVWETGEPAEEEYGLVADGRTKYRLAKYVRFSDREILGIVRDITDRKRAEMEKAGLEIQLRQSQKMEAIGTLAAGIAHEINTPTQYVANNVGFLQDAFVDFIRVIAKYGHLAETAKAGGPLSDILAVLEGLLQEVDFSYLIEEIPVCIEQTQEGLDRISKIVQSMKEFAHPGPENMTPTDLNRAIQNTVTVARNEWKYVAEMEMNLDSGLPLVPCVIGEMNQVVLNLIVNAAQAIGEKAKKAGTNEKGTITVSTKLVDKQAEIRISDTGIGIPASMGSRVFDPFFTTKAPGKGTGQGLAIAYRIITDKHRGTITYTSQEGRGTTFFIRLPLETT